MHANSLSLGSIKLFNVIDIPNTFLNFSTWVNWVLVLCVLHLLIRVVFADVRRIAATKLHLIHTPSQSTLKLLDSDCLKCIFFTRHGSVPYVVWILLGRTTWFQINFKFCNLLQCSQIRLHRAHLKSGKKEEYS